MDLKKKTFSRDQFKAKVKGTGLDPFYVAKFHEKPKCTVYLYYRLGEENTGSLFEPNRRTPNWYVYLYLYENLTARRLDGYKNSIYRIIMKNPRPLECLEFIIKRISFYGPGKLAKYNSNTPEVDIEFY